MKNTDIAYDDVIDFLLSPITLVLNIGSEHWQLVPDEPLFLQYDELTSPLS
jgi:hypothetical protein